MHGSNGKFRFGNEWSSGNVHADFIRFLSFVAFRVVTKNSDLEKSSVRKKLFKTELLQLTADELNYSLCLFVKEVRKPNGSEYAPDTIYYLVLGIQEYLYENGRIDNIFTDPYYERFTDCLDEVAKKFSVLYNDSRKYQYSFDLMRPYCSRDLFPWSDCYASTIWTFCFHVSFYRIYCYPCGRRALVGVQTARSSFAACSTQHAHVFQHKAFQSHSMFHKLLSQTRLMDHEHADYLD